MGGLISDNHDVLPLASTARVVLLTPDWSGVLDASTACRFQLRLSREDILGGGASVFDPADDRVDHARAEQRRTGTFHGRLRLLPQDGTPFEATVSVTAGSPATGEDGVPQALATMTYEPDRRVPPELEQNWSRHPLHLSPDVVALYEADGTLRYISPSVADVLGWTPEEMTGRVTIDLVHPDDVEPMLDSMLSVAETTGPPSPVTFRVLHKDGRWRHMEVMLKDLSDDPDVGGSTVHFRDVSDRVDELGASYFEGLATLDGSSVGIANLTLDGSVTRSNDRFLEILGRSRGDRLDLVSLSESLHPEDRDAHRAELLRVAREGTASVAEWRHLRTDGSVVWVTWKAQRPVRSGVSAELLVVSIEDASARKEAEHALGLLTPREQEVLGMICRGLDNGAIAREMFISVHTVKHHVRGVLEKLEVPDRRRAAERVAALHPSPTTWPRD